MPAVQNHFLTKCPDTASLAAFHKIQNKMPYYLVVKVDFLNGIQKYLDGSSFLKNYKEIEADISQYSFFVKKCYTIVMENGSFQKKFNESSELEEDLKEFDLQAFGDKKDTFLTALNGNKDDKTLGKCQFIVATIFDQPEERAHWLVSAKDLLREEPEKSQVLEILAGTKV